MADSRTERRAKARDRRRRFVLPAAILILGVLCVVALVVAVSQGLVVRARTAAAAPPAATAPVQATVAANTAEIPIGKPTVKVLVEVPDVRGKPLDAARLVMSTAGFEVASLGENASTEASALVVVSQIPIAGAKLPRGEDVTVTVAPAGTPGARRVIVVIDPGHQARADLRPEPVGPGSSTSKERVTAGAVGVATRRTEAAVALELSGRIAARLRRAGIDVLLTRTSDDVDLGNAERAKLAARWGADLFLRVHADGMVDPAVRGVSVLYPDGNRWVAPISAASRRAAGSVCAAVVHAASTPDRGVIARADLAGFNWAACPSILFEAGCLSNAADDRLLATAAYQDRVADGVSRGVLAYFGR